MLDTLYSIRNTTSLPSILCTFFLGVQCVVLFILKKIYIYFYIKIMNILYIIIFIIKKKMILFLS